MSDKLPWSVEGEVFADGSRLADWVKVYQSSEWHWQYDTHEMTFAIYEHDGQYWKLYRIRYVGAGEKEYTYRFGGVACRAVEVEYLNTARSPHSSMLKHSGDLEWVRVHEYDSTVHRLVRAGECSDKYGEPHGARAA